MFCSFDAAPRIMRWFCWGRVVEWDGVEFGEVLGRMGRKREEEGLLGARAVVLLEVFKGGFFVEFLFFFLHTLFLSPS